MPKENNTPRRRPSAWSGARNEAPIRFPGGFPQNELWNSSSHRSWSSPVPEESPDPTPRIESNPRRSSTPRIESNPYRSDAPRRSFAPDGSAASRRSFTPRRGATPRRNSTSDSNSTPRRISTSDSNSTPRRISTPRNNSTPRRSSTPRVESKPRLGSTSRRSSRPRTNSRIEAYSDRIPLKVPLPRILFGAVALVVLVVLGVAGFNFVQGLPFKVDLNGEAYELGGEKNVASILASEVVSPQPGDFLAVDGSILEEGGGEALLVSVNGKETTDFSLKLNPGDKIVIDRGKDIVEPSQDTKREIPFETYESGRGAITILASEGQTGIETTKLGSISGITATEMTVEREDRVFLHYNPDVGADKVIALTFDDGPWTETTSELLDVLKENEVVATFFVVGELIVDDKVDLVKRMQAEGHEPRTHSFDHARGAGQSIDLGLMTPEERIAEVEKGYASIAEATGEEPSHVFRAPSNNYSFDTMQILSPYVSAHIGWHIDTGDWLLPGVEVIEEEILSAKTGSIILAHDGGGDRSQTVEAFRKALPKLKQQGFRFITMDELLKYPPLETE